MLEAPKVTVVDPSRPGPLNDVLVAGGDRPRRRVPRRVLVASAVLALLGGVTGLGVHRHQQHLAELRAKATAFAKADTIHVHIRLAPGGPTATSEAASSGRTDPPPVTANLSVPLLVSDDPEGLTRIQSVQVLGTGVQTEFDDLASSGRYAGDTDRTASVNAPFLCSEVAAGHYPTLTTAIVTVIPASGRLHRLTLPLRKVSNQTVLEACLLPDPKALPAVSTEEQHGRLLLVVEGISHSRSPLHILRVTSPGFALAVKQTPGMPDGIGPNFGVYLDLSVKVTDCVGARSVEPLTVVLRGALRTYTVRALDSPANSYRKPGSHRLKVALAAACP